MRLAEKIYSRIENLPETYQAEVLDFVEFLESKSKKPREYVDEDREIWSRFSLAKAMQGMEDEEDLYSRDDLVEAFLMVRDGQIVLVRFPQTDQDAGKLRPALVVRRLPGRHDDWLISLISSNLSQQLPDFDEVVRESDEDFTTSGSKVASLIRIGRLAVVDQQLFIGSIGRLSDARVRAIKSRLSRWISESPTSV